MKLPSILDLNDQQIEDLRKIYYIYQLSPRLDSHARRIYRQKACKTDHPAKAYREMLSERQEHARRIYLTGSGISMNDLASLSNMGILVPDGYDRISYYMLTRNGLNICNNLFNSNGDYLKKLSSIRQSLNQVNEQRYITRKHDKRAFRDMIDSIWKNSPIYGFENVDEVIKVYETKENYLKAKLIQSLLNEHVHYNLVVLYRPENIIVYIDHSPTKAYQNKNAYVAVTIYKGRWEMLVTLEDIFANKNQEQSEKIYHTAMALMNVMQMLELK